MAENATLGASPTFAERMLAHSRERQREAEKVVSIATRSADGAPGATDERRRAGANPDFSSAIDLIHEASEAIRISEQRANDLEAQMKGLVEEAAAEVKRLKAEIAARDAEIASKQQRVQATEARAHEAEAWLARLNEAVVSSLAPLQRRKTS